MPETSPLKIRSETSGEFEHHLDRRHPAAAVAARDQPLRDEGPDVERQVHQQLRAAFLGEEVDDPVERLVGAVGVQRGEAEVAGLGERDRVVHRLALAHLADQDHVRRLAQGVLQRRPASPSVSTPTSRWVTMQLRCSCTNSIGSSIVMMWP